jgi:prepilin-type N-terminal cleavage/methylation domain-containing protein
VSLTRERSTNDAGFTLIELLIAISILGVLTVSLVTAFFATFTANDQTLQRLDSTRSEQFSAAWFADDVAGAATVSASTSAGCGAGTAVVSLAGTTFDPASVTAARTTDVAYVFSTRTENGTTFGVLERRACERDTANALVRTSTVTVASSLAATAPTVSCSPSPCSASTRTVVLTAGRGDGSGSFVLTGALRRTP